MPNMAIKPLTRVRSDRQERNRNACRSACIRKFSALLSAAYRGIMWIGSSVSKNAGEGRWNMTDIGKLFIALKGKDVAASVEFYKKLGFAPEDESRWSDEILRNWGVQCSAGMARPL